MANYKVKGIILKRSNFGEADRILTIFTDRLGKIKAIGKGIRKQMSRSGGHLEPFCLSSLVVAEGKNLDIITEAQTIECFFVLRSNLDSTQLSYYITEAIDRLTVEHEKHAEVYELLVEVLKNIDFRKNLLLSYFEINLLSYLGFRPELEHCLVCQENKAQKFCFDNIHGGIVCEDCSKNGLKITLNGIKLLRLFLKNNLKGLEKIKIPDKNAVELRKICESYIDHVSGQEFKSRRFLK